MRAAIPAVLGVALLGVASQSCRPASGTGPGEPTAMSPQLASDLATVRAGRILFMHHSVGRNLLAGIGALDAEVGGERLRVVPFEEGPPPQGPWLAHFSGGQNKDPKGKIDAFAAAVRRAPPPDGAVALMKLCYVDFEPASDVEALFAHYRRTIEALQEEYPGIRFAHVSAPLKVRPTDLKSAARRLLGRQVWEDAANMKRAEYNRRLAEAFPAESIFDLARVEATAPDGTPTAFEHGEGRYASLYPGYTDDGGHLNGRGQRAAGAAAIRFLAGALGGPNPGR